MSSRSTARCKWKFCSICPEKGVRRTCYATTLPWDKRRTKIPVPHTRVLAYRRKSKNYKRALTRYLTPSLTKHLTIVRDDDMHWDMPAFYMYGWFVNLSALLVLNCWILKSLFTKNSKRSGRLSATNWIRRYTCTQNCRSVASPSSPIGLPQGFGFSVWISNPSERRPQGLLLPLGLPYRILCLESRRKIGSDVRAVRAVRMLPTDVRRSFKKYKSLEGWSWASPSYPSKRDWCPS